MSTFAAKTLQLTLTLFATVLVLVKPAALKRRFDISEQKNHPKGWFHPLCHQQKNPPGGGFYLRGRSIRNGDEVPTNLPDRSGQTVRQGA